MTAITRASTLILGDSQAEGLERSGELDGVKIEDFRGMSVPFFLRWITTPEAGLALRGRAQVYLQVGGNDVVNGRNASQIISDMRALIAEVHRLAPEARIVLGTIPVRGRYFDTLPAEEARAERRALRLVNEWILSNPPELAACRGVAFDTNAIIADPARPDRPTRSFGSSDGRHLTREGYVALADAFLDRFIDAAPAMKTRVITPSAFSALRPPKAGGGVSVRAAP